MLQFRKSKYLSNLQYKLNHKINVSFLTHIHNPSNPQCKIYFQNCFTNCALQINIMSFLSCTGKAKKKYLKFGLVDIFRQKIKHTKPAQQVEQQKLNKFVTELAEDQVSYHRIQALAWNGIPHCLRPKIWKYLLRYALIQGTEDTLIKKRNQYQTLVSNYWKPQEFNEGERKIFQTIDGDVKRIGVEFNSAFKEQILQSLLKRMLYIWHMRHPASGYVQGMCDLVNPFLIVFISQYLPVDQKQGKFLVPVTILENETLKAIEADIYWCTSKMLQYVIKNYTNGFGGIHEAYSKVQQLLFSIDQQLYKHLTKQKIDLFSLSLRSISTMLLRMFNPLVGVRLFDTYISYEDQYPTLMIYLLITILEKFAKKMLSLRGDDLMTYMQKLPTKEWTEADLEIVIAEAFALKKIYSKKS